MQQAYQALRVISEAQTVRMVLTGPLNELLLGELCTACETLRTAGSDGIKAVVLDFGEQIHTQSENQPGLTELLARAEKAVRAVPQPMLAVVRANLSASACRLLAVADFTLIAHEAEICLPSSSLSEKERQRVGGVTAARLGYATWSAPAADLKGEMERILSMLRNKSAVALRHAKASTRLNESASTRLEALQRINQFYLETATVTRDAQEGLRAFLQKHPPRWQNR